MSLKNFNLDYCFPMCFRYTIPVFLILLGLFGCATVLYVPTEADAQSQSVSLDTLIAGRELYMNRCGSCHNLYLPTQYSKQEWTQILDKMQKPAKIDTTQKELIKKYINLSLN